MNQTSNATRAVEDFAALAGDLTNWFNKQVLQISVGVEIVAIMVAIVLSTSLGRPIEKALRERLARFMDAQSSPYLAGVVSACIGTVWLAIFVAINGALFVATKLTPWPYHPFKVAISLALAVMVIRVCTPLIPNRMMGRVIGFLALAAAALSSLGILNPVVDYLETVNLSIGENGVSIYALIKGVVLLILLIAAARFFARLLDRRIAGSPDITPSLQVLWSKVIHISFPLIAIFVALKSIGFSLTTITVFSGAVGVGIGFGLQKIFSNLISGVILLLENSVKPGDTIEVTNIYGQIKSMNARFVSMVSRDGKEYLIPNEKFIVNDVVNWTYSSSEVRLRIPVGIPYDADLEQALAILEAAPKGIPRVLESPAPRAVAKQFGADSIDLELRVWIGDPESGVGRVRSALVVAVWKAFKEAGIEIPYPQRDLHLVSVPDEIPVVVKDKE